MFQASSQFADQCQTVRTGVDIEGNAFPDRAGSTTIENFWLRSWSNETYLWNTEIIDRNPATFTDRLAYFAVLKTLATTPSGRDKDEFHFSQPTADYLRDRNSAPRAGYGAEIAVFRSTPPRDVRVLYIDAGSPAAEQIGGVANLRRGTRILSVDGIDLVNGGTTQAQINTLNDGLFPATAGENHTLIVQDPSAPTTRTINLRSANLTPQTVNRTTVVNGNVGYVAINTFSPFAAEKDIADAINTLRTRGVSDLVIDLRYNGGGLLALASQLSYMAAGDARTTGLTFERLQFNAAAGNRNPVTGEVNSPTPFFRTGLGFSLTDGTPLSTLNLSRVFVLSTESTCSASEAVINGLRGIDVEVVLIGGKTCGKPYGFYPTDNCGQTYYTIQFQGVNNKGFGDYADGFVPQNSSAAFGVRAPGCEIADDLTRDLGDPNEAMLSAALAYRASGQCPSGITTQSAATSERAEGRAIRTHDLTPGEQILRNNRDMRMPD